METTVYESRSEALDAAAEQIKNREDLPLPVVRNFLDRAGVIEERQPDGETRLPRQLQPALVGHFVIKNDALYNVNNFLTLLKTILKLGVGIAGIKTLAGAAAAIDSLHAFYKLYCDIVAQGFVLSDEQLAVVGVLRDLGTATAAEIAKQMNETIAPTAVEAVLVAFERTKDRTTGFAVRDDKELWALVDV